MSKKRTNKTKPSAKQAQANILGDTIGKLEADKLQEHIRVLKFSKKGAKTKYCICTWDIENKGWKPQACFDSRKRAMKAYTNVSLATYYQVGLTKDTTKDGE